MGRSTLGLRAGLLAAATGACSARLATSDPNDETTPMSQAVRGGTLVFVQSTRGGYAFSELNAPARAGTVAALDLSSTGIDARDIAGALAEPRTVVVLGAVQGDALVASAVYRALPAVVPAPGDAFFLGRVQRDGDVASAVNLGEEWMLGRLDVSRLAPRTRSPPARSSAPWTDSCSTREPSTCTCRTTRRAPSPSTHALTAPSRRMRATPRDVSWSRDARHRPNVRASFRRAIRGTSSLDG
jgi:hypothetical protein